jgi:hypothetical protein
MSEHGGRELMRLVAKMEARDQGGRENDFSHLSVKQMIRLTAGRIIDGICKKISSFWSKP